MDLTRYIQPEFFFGASFCIVTTFFGDFLDEFSFSVGIQKKIASEMKEIAKFLETIIFFPKKS
jgi:hypothetical protein